MIGHSFGLTASVYNYNRRSAMINTILKKEFGLVSDFYFDDKYGFEPEVLAEKALEIVKGVHSWLGASFQSSKTQLNNEIVLLGVLHDLVEMTMKVTKTRRLALKQEINGILFQEWLDHGHAGKLKGRLQFASGQFWGKFGRCSGEVWGGNALGNIFWVSCEYFREACLTNAPPKKGIIGNNMK